MAGSKRRNGQAPTKSHPRPATLQDFKRKLPFRVWHTVVLDNEAATALDEARSAYNDAKALYESARSRHLNYPSNAEAKTAHDEALTALAEAIAVHEDAREAAEDVTVTMILRFPPHHEYDLLCRAHPLTDDDREKLSKEKDFPEDKWPDRSPSTFPPAFIAACLIEPEMTAEQVAEEIWLNPDWNESEKQGLLAAAYSAANSARVNLGKVGGVTSTVAPNKDSAIVTPSPEASS